MKSRKLALLLTLGLSLGVTSFTAPAKADGEARPQVVARMQVAVPPNAGENLREAGPNGTGMIVNSKTRRAYQLIHQYGDLVPHTWITAFDTDTLQPVGQLELPLKAAFPGPDAIDRENGRFFVLLFDNTSVAGIAVVDESSFGPGKTPKADIVRPNPDPAYASPLTLAMDFSAIAGYRYEPSVQKLYIALSPQRQMDETALRLSRGRQLYGTFVAQWDAKPGQLPSQDWVHLIRECSSGPIGLEVGATNTPFLSEDHKAVQMLCGSGEVGWQYVSVPLGDNLGRPATGPGAPAAKVWPGPNRVHRILVDPAVQRTHVLAESSYGATFDWRNGRLLGTFAVSQTVYSGNLYPGIDPATGRIYVLVPPVAGDAGTRQELGGLFLVDGRRTPVPQALAYREFVHPAAINAIAVDSEAPGRTRKVFSRGGPSTNSGFPFWDVIEDPVPVSQDPKDTVPDQTADIDEAEGKTERAYAGEASGYGSRFMTVGGAYRGAMSDWAGACAIANREIRFGTVTRSSLSSVGAAARADTIDGDLGTQADFNDSERCWPQLERKGTIPVWPAPPSVLGDASPKWTAKPAECSGTGTNEDGTGTDGRTPGATAATTCAQDKEKLDADAAFGPVAGPVSVGRSHNVVHMERNTERGVVSTSESIAESIVFEGVGSIGIVRAVAETWAKGRTPKATDPPRGVWTVEVCGVTTATYKQEGCKDPEPAIAALNEAGRGRLVFSRPKADPVLLQGTPKGYLAAIQRDRGEASLALIEHGDESLVIPGLEVQIRNQAGYEQKDVNRHVLQLAGVRTASVYGISQLPQEVSGSVLPPSGPIETSIVDGDPLTAGAVGGLVMPPPPNAMPTAPKNPGERVIEVLGDAAQVGLRFFRRTLIDSLLMAGIWSTFGLASYLGARRRRITALS